MFGTPGRALSTFLLLWAVSSVPYTIADGNCIKTKDGKDEVCVDRMPVGANVLIVIAFVILLILGITLIVCMHCCKRRNLNRKQKLNHSRSNSNSSTYKNNNDFLFDSEQMRGPPTIIETSYNPASGKLTPLYESATSPTFPERAKSPVFPDRERFAHVHVHHAPALPPRHLQQGAEMQQKRNKRLSLPVSFPTPQPMSAPATKATFGLSVANPIPNPNQYPNSHEGLMVQRPPSYEGQGVVSPSAYPATPQTAFVTGNFDRPPQHPSIRRSQRRA